MMCKSNFHTHTFFCDGQDSPEDLVLKAIDMGFESIGFSGHSFTDFDTSYCMSREDTQKYIDEISRLKIFYNDKIKIFCGIEKDYFSFEDDFEFDYVIGSVHYIKKDGVYYEIDKSPEDFSLAAEKGWKGDIYAMVEDYYALVGDVAEKTHADIIGHFDLITKFNENEKFFRSNHPRYVAAAQNAAKKLLNSKALFEVNTGAMSRGYRDTPYPDERILNYLVSGGAKFIFSSDCHNKDFLSYGYEKAEKILTDLGAKGFDTLFLD